MCKRPTLYSLVCDWQSVGAALVGWGGGNLETQVADNYLDYADVHGHTVLKRFSI